MKRATLGATRQAEWRARNPEISKEKSRKNSKLYREKLKHILTPEQKLENRRKHAEHKRIYRAEKRAGSDLHVPPHQVRKLFFSSIFVLTI